MIKFVALFATLLAVSVSQPAESYYAVEDYRGPEYRATTKPLAEITDKVFFDIEVNGEPIGRVVWGLYGKVVPKTVKNFVTLSTGTAGLSNSGKPLHYKGTVFHRILPGFMAQSGDFENFDGTGGESIYGGSFIDENFHIRHEKPYLLTMYHKEKNQNTS